MDADEVAAFLEPWDFEQYARLLAAAKIEGPDWYTAVCLAGEAGLRSGEVKALRWREDVDMIAKTIPPAVIEASLGEADPDRRVLKMLGAVAKTEAGRDESSMILVS